MLVLSRHTGQEINLQYGRAPEETVRIVVQRMKGNEVRIGFDAPQSVRILRGELGAFEPETKSGPILTPDELAQRLIAAADSGEAVLIISGHREYVAHCRAIANQVERDGYRTGAILAIGLDDCMEAAS